MNDLTIFILGASFGIFTVLMALAWLINAFTGTIATLGQAALTTEKAAKKVEESKEDE